MTPARTAEGADPFGSAPSPCTRTGVADNGRSAWHRTRSTLASLADRSVLRGDDMSRDETAAMRDTELEKDRARYGLIAVVMSNLGIAGVAIFGVWRLDGDKAVIVGVL